MIVQVGTVTNNPTLTGLPPPAEQRYDWGAPLLPVNSLSALVVVPMAKGCATDNCDLSGSSAAYNGSCVDKDGTTNSRSPVWVSPVEACFVKITQSKSPSVAAYGCDGAFKVEDGGDGATCRVDNAYASVRFAAGAAPFDISGAVIQAYKCDPAGSTCDEITGTPVKIAVMWGQDPAWSGTLAARIFL